MNDSNSQKPQLADKAKELLSVELDLPTEQDTHKLGEQIAAFIKAPTYCYLEGELGVGKTRLVRSIIQSLGHKGSVKSPTYTLVEPYQFDGFVAYHFDLYRLSDPEELEFLGIRDYFEDDSMAFIEWPTKGKGWLVKADLLIELKYEAEGRKCKLCAYTETGKILLLQLISAD